MHYDNPLCRGVVDINGVEFFNNMRVNTRDVLF